MIFSIFLMQSIKKSECPKELEPEDRRSSVNVNLIRRTENYRVSFLFELFGLSLFNLLLKHDEFRPCLDKLLYKHL